MRRPGILALLLVVATACGNSADSEPRTITVGGDRVTVATLVDAQAGLCDAAGRARAGDPVAARAAFFDRSHDALHSVARALEDVDRAEAAELLETKEKVESGFDSRPPTLAADIAHLAEVYRDGLGRLAISATPCEK